MDCHRDSGDFLSQAGQVLETIEGECEVLANDNDDSDLLRGDVPDAAGGEEPPELDEGFFVKRKHQPVEAPGNYESEEVIERRALPDPGQPTEQEFEDHCIDHANYRSWCKHCVQARGRGEPHRGGKQGRRRRRIPCFHFDYMFVTKTGRILTREELSTGSEEISLKIIVAKDSWTKSVFAHVVDKKGLDERGYVIDRLMEDLRWLGYSRVALRSDNEKAIIQVLKRALVTAKVQVIDDEGEPPERTKEGWHEE